MEYEIVIKPTDNKKASFGLQANGLMKYVGGHGLNGLGVGRMYEMYFISNMPITAKMISEGLAVYVPEKEAYYKIESTTEEKLNLQLISVEFLNRFVDAYNKDFSHRKSIPFSYKVSMFLTHSAIPGRLYYISEFYLTLNP